jgi:CrcB protein
VLLFVGGGLGTLLRYGLGGFVQERTGAAFPWGTLAVNLSGCFAIGVLAALADERGALSAQARLFLFVGVLGGFTTFSSFGLETWRLVQASDLAAALANAVGSLLGGLVGVALGVFIGRSLP